MGVKFSAFSIQNRFTFPINTNNEETSIKDITLNWTAAASCFQGRSDTLKRIKKKFTANKIIVLHGMPGIGKTETARNFANRYSKYYKGNLIWVFAETPDNIKKGFNTLAETLNLKTKDVSQIYSKLKTSKALLIFDNAENMSSIKNFLPPSQVQANIDVLITSRLSTWDSAICTIPLDSLKIEDALEIFKTKLGDKFKEYSVEIWTELVKQLDGIPLCLQIVSSLIYQELQGIHLEKFNLEEFFNKLKETFIDWEMPETEQNYYNETVLSAIHSALDRLEMEEAELSIDLLCFIAYLDPDYIYASGLLQCPSMKNSKELLEKALSKLSNYSLIHVIIGRLDPKVKVHRTVQLVIRKYDLSRNKGQTIKNIWRSIKIDSVPPMTDYVNKEEYQQVAWDVCNEDNFSFHQFLLHLASYHCDVILHKVFPLISAKYQDAEEYVFVLNRMLLWAIRKPHTDLNTIRFLINHGATITNIENFILRAALWLSTDMLDVALKLNSRDHILPEDDFKGLLLHGTVQYSYYNVKEAINCINYLINKEKANIFYEDKKSNNILHYASENFETMKYFVEKFNLKSLVNSQNKEKDTPLLISFKKNRYYSSEYVIPIFTYLIIECEADIAIQDAKGWNILFYICRHGSFELIEWLLNNCDCSKIINVQDCEENVAFRYLIFNRLLKESEKIQLIASFAQNKMNFNVRNKDDETLYEIALGRDLKKLTKKIKKYCEDRTHV